MGSVSSTEADTSDQLVRRRDERQCERMRDADALIPELQAAAAEADAQCDLPAPLIARMNRLGMLRMLQPAHWGGDAASLRDFLAVQRRIAEGSVSAAWVQGVFSVQGFVLAQYDARAQEDIWADDPATLVCSSFQPVGRVIMTDGGFRLSGRWSFSSGCVHADWSLLGAIAPGEGEGDRHMRTFLLPKADYRIDRIWNPSGLRATGSHDIIADDVFVPDYRTWRVTAGLVPESPDAISGAAVHRLP
ncbi:MULTISPECIES: acyl-CoA dehydrogenase family protein [unclassified Sphingobium]|uniref:acyl-CoA dehydrogenase family protein n=1 Tax=unclassified Sphingobium TaxID=2611147 RepID=UPI00119A10C8|nr:MULTISPECIES: acyl-CoA dehydrogenase family protein [unclassified Sphingobium]MBG6119990.1 alkylation response protein AidB-like acyl-CoA dehydrogenase [Sphingobium sp. JAI105]TWC99571.1 hypothetical protein FB595_1222 [Sphingobium sp. AEW010]TWD18992.1 hypothetical protein FB596_12354 [Sphingobium sp. AEW013]TWD21863.1 hypothetical protein FB594_12254 [Sphingobium sp. AEW001]